MVMMAPAYATAMTIVLRLAMGALWATQYLSHIYRIIHFLGDKYLIRETKKPDNR
jgi:hypothetical protein